MTDAIRAELARVAGVLEAPDAAFVLERPRDSGHGDLATNLAMVVAKSQKTNPRKIAERVIAELRFPDGMVAKTEIAGPGFINFWLGQDELTSLVRRILSEGERYGRSTASPTKRINVEFVSANPTGPLHVGHGRGAALGDGIAALLDWTGHQVTREFYINDAGVQIDRLAESLLARIRQEAGLVAELPEGGYHGDYLRENARQILASRNWNDRSISHSSLASRRIGESNHPTFRIPRTLSSRMNGLPSPFASKNASTAFESASVRDVSLTG